MQFSKVVGQSELKELLIKEINSEKIGHAKLFLGQDGYGTLPLAIAYVQYLFCSNKQATDSCGQCPSCLKMESLQHPDLHFTFPTVLADAKISSEKMKQWREMVLANPYFDLNGWVEKIDPKGRKPVIGTDESMEIIKALSLKSFEGGYKVVIVWNVDEMNAVASNKLLKTLEEPPAQTIFLLIAPSQENLLQTIISRAQTIRVPRLVTAELSKFLREKHELNLSKADSIALRAEGNLVEAEQFISENSKQADDTEMFIELMRVCYKKDVIKMLDWSERIGAETKERQKSFLQYCLHMFRQSLLKNYTDDMLMRVSDDEANFLKNFARFITGNNIFSFNDTFNNAYYYIDRNANSKLVFTNLSFNVMRYIHFA